jgi:U6 snRNA-associated Sm-like protein LSm7
MDASDACFALPPCATFIPDPDDPLRVTDATRPLGLVVLRGTSVMVVAPTDGTEEIANPFAGGDE